MNRKRMVVLAAGCIPGRRLSHSDRKRGINLDSDAVRMLYQALLSAWNRRNAAGYAELFVEGGFAVGFDGSQHEASGAMESDLNFIFAHHPTAAYVGKVREVRFLAPDVALLRAVAGMVRPGETDLYPPVNAIQTLTAVRRDDAWRIAAFQNTPAAFHGRPELVEQLTAELRAELRAQRAQAQRD